MLKHFIFEGVEFVKVGFSISEHAGRMYHQHLVDVDTQRAVLHKTKLLINNNGTRDQCNRRDKLEDNQTLSQQQTFA